MARKPTKLSIDEVLENARDALGPDDGFPISLEATGLIQDGWHWAGDSANFFVLVCGDQIAVCSKSNEDVRIGKSRRAVAKGRK